MSQCYASSSANAWARDEGQREAIELAIERADADAALELATGAGARDAVRVWAEDGCELRTLAALIAARVRWRKYRRAADQAAAMTALDDLIGEIEWHHVNARRGRP